MGKQNICFICGNKETYVHGTYLKYLEPKIQEKLKYEYPALTGDDFICSDDILNLRLKFIMSESKKELLETNELDQNILMSIRNHSFTSKDTSFSNKHYTVGEKVADNIAKFGGSWLFIFIFMLIIICWITLNATALLFHAFDPFPFILLNLILSCLAAIQAPIIMMSQNRQEVRDRIQSENDYEVNLKAEIEVRLLHEKIDYLLFNQIKEIYEQQDIQIKLLEKITKDLKSKDKAF